MPTTRDMTPRASIISLVNSLPICTTAAIRVLEEQAAAAPLMEMAGAAAAGQARLLAPRVSDPVTVFAGPGNNGGDAFVVARHLREWGYAVTVVFCAVPDVLPAAARNAHDRWRAAGGTTQSSPPALSECGLVVDGLFGIGLRRALNGNYAEWIAAINRADCPVLALDIPSGLDADTGTCGGPAVRATHTATFIALKPGLLTAEGVDIAGEVTLHDLGMDARMNAAASGRFVTWALARHWLHRRLRNTHKGSFGTLGIVGGGAGMTGAPLLAGRAALFAGAGKVHLGFLADAAPSVDFGQPELMLRAADEVLRGESTALVVGPGLGQSRLAADHLGRALSKSMPLVVDADALNLLALEPGLCNRMRNRDHPTLLTPHPAEAARLLQTSNAVVQADRVAAAKLIAERFNAAVALKGAGTVCAFPGGGWAINGSGNPGLASAGSGDVLSGIVGALLAQGYAAERALLLGVCVHGAAADSLVAAGAGPIGLTASELALAVRRLLN
jgi:ADP-dependent NAD(P)H-hydrate dehydratase / NAD(P)H-hydrate epimerase